MTRTAARPLTVTAPRIALDDLITAGQNLRYTHLTALVSGDKLRYTLNIDTSYPAQSIAKVETWTANGWTIVWAVDPATIEKCGGRPDWREVTVKTVNAVVKELAAKASIVLS